MCLECGNPKPKSDKLKKSKCSLKCLNCREVNKFCPENQRANVDHSAVDLLCPTCALESSQLRGGLNMTKLITDQQNVGKSITTMDDLQADLNDYDIFYWCILYLC